MTDRTEVVGHPEWSVRAHLLAGHVIPAHPLALDANRALDERRQRGLTLYYLAAGSGGLAVGVHTTQFAIREAGLYRPVLELAAETVRASATRPVAMVAGVVGGTDQAIRDAQIGRDLGYHAALLSLGAWRDANDADIIAHCARIAQVLPLFGFYLQPAVGGRTLSYRFWRDLCDIPDVLAIKVAPFDRYRTVDVMRAVADSGRHDIALYTGNDDSIVADLVMSYTSGEREVRFVGGLLGQWAMWTKRAAEMHDALRGRGSIVAAKWLSRAHAITDANGAIFDARNAYAGCIPGIHEVLRRQGLLAGTWCLDQSEQLSPGQAEDIARVCASYPWLTDDEFVREHIDEWQS